MSFATTLHEKRRLLERYRKMQDFDAVLEVCGDVSGTCADFAAGKCQVAIRHDMDSDCENAVRMAEWEHANGLRSTYFVLHTDWYYRHQGQITPLVRDALARIASLGHEIGLHNNTVAASLMGQGKPADIMRRELAELRALGYEVTGSAAHGDSLCKLSGVTNFDVFSGGDFGLAYEAYSLGHQEYLSDNGGKWNDDPARIAEAVRDGGTAVVLMHPLHWLVP